MSSSVVHLDPALHARIKAHCKANKVRLKDWVGAVMREALGDTPAGDIVLPSRPQPKAKALFSPNDTEAEAWARPPFWKEGS